MPKNTDNNPAHTESEADTTENITDAQDKSPVSSELMPGSYDSSWDEIDRKETKENTSQTTSQFHRWSDLPPELRELVMAKLVEGETKEEVTELLRGPLLANRDLNDITLHHLYNNVPANDIDSKSRSANAENLESLTKELQRKSEDGENPNIETQLNDFFKERPHVCLRLKNIPAPMRSPVLNTLTNSTALKTVEIDCTDVEINDAIKSCLTSLEQKYSDNPLNEFILKIGRNPNEMVSFFAPALNYFTIKPDWLKNIQSLTSLEVKNCGIENWEFLNGKTRLKSLTAENMNLTSENLNTIVANLPSIEELDISDNYLGDTTDAVDSLAPLKKLDNLKKLRARKCGLSDVNLRTIRSITSIKELDISGNPLTNKLHNLLSPDQNGTIDEIISKSAKHQHLEKLTVRNCSLNDDDVRSIGDLRTLKSLNMGMQRLFNPNPVLPAELMNPYMGGFYTAASPEDPPCTIRSGLIGLVDIRTTPQNDSTQKIEFKPKNPHLKELVVDSLSLDATDIAYAATHREMTSLDISNINRVGRQPQNGVFLS